MSAVKATEIYVSPGTVPLLILFIVVASPVALASLLLAALTHELGHYLLLRQFGACVAAVRITVFGAEMRLADRPQLSYGQELLAVAAGPSVNLILGILLATVGEGWTISYLFSGAQLVLGLFNLLPIRPMDGGTILWLIIAWLTDPFLADRWTRAAGIIVSGGMLLCGGWLWLQKGSPFLFLGAMGLMKNTWIEKRLVKGKKSR